MIGSLPGHEVRDRAKAKKLLAYVPVHGALFADYTPRFSIEMFQIRGAE
jgi:hypothetical protein